MNWYQQCLGTITYNSVVEHFVWRTGCHDWVQIPPEAARLSLRVDFLRRVVLYCVGG